MFSRRDPSSPEVLPLCGLPADSGAARKPAAWRQDTAAATRESPKSDDGEEDAGESDAVRDELRGIGKATVYADELPVDVEDPEVRALVSGGRRRQVEPRVFGRAKGHVAVDFVLRDQRGPNVSPQGVRLPGFRNERRDED